MNFIIESLSPEGALVIINALSREILAYQHKTYYGDKQTLREYVAVYKVLHAEIDRKFPNWIFTNEETAKVLAKF